MTTPKGIYPNSKQVQLMLHQDHGLHDITIPTGSALMKEQTMTLRNRASTKDDEHLEFKLERWETKIKTKTLSVEKKGSVLLWFFWWVYSKQNSTILSLRFFLYPLLTEQISSLPKWNYSYTGSLFFNEKMAFSNSSTWNFIKISSSL